MEERVLGAVSVDLRSEQLEKWEEGERGDEERRPKFSLGARSTPQGPTPLGFGMQTIRTRRVKERTRNVVDSEYTKWTRERSLEGDNAPKKVNTQDAITPSRLPSPAPT